MKKYIRKLWNKIKVVHSSRVMLKSGITTVQDERLSICSNCSWNSDNNKNKSVKNKIFLVLNKVVNKFYGLKVTVTAICTFCNCDLSVMSSVDNENHECKLGKWK